MTKHIDLLRAHQQSPQSNIASEKDARSSLPGPHMSNPYSLPTRNAAHDSMIEELPAQQALLEEDYLYERDNEPQVADTRPEKSPDLSSDLEDFEISKWLVGISQDTLRIFHGARQNKPEDTTTLNRRLRSLLHHFDSNSNTLNELELEVSRNIRHICDTTDVSLNDLVQKSIMMMLYTIKVGLQLKIEHPELIHYTVAAMLHHIGMAIVPDYIRQKADKLTDDEVRLIKQAPEMAVAYLKSCHIDNDSILTAAAQASERHDGSGASGLSGKKINWSARIIGLLSMFESFIHVRPYRQRLLPRDAIRELVNHHKKAFDPVILRALIESISLYPVGTFVQLNTGEFGQVISVHSKFPLRPIVQIYMDKRGNLISKREINLKQQPNLMIKKCMYEESLEEYTKQ